ncbi:MAG: chemotaxis protein CheA [Tissierellia bacterium]|nr:chemotaxis protein CheA [Tissierellia bacterium]
MDLDMNQYMNLFIEEVNEHLQNMNDILLELEKDTTNTSLINELFRVAHTLKGMSGTMGFVNMADLTHEMENVLDEVRNNRIKLNESIVDILFECFDVLDENISYIIENKKEMDSSNKELIDRLRSIVSIDNNNDSASSMENVENSKMNNYVMNVINEASKRGLNVFNIDISLSPTCMLKSARAFVIINTLDAMGDIVYTNPPTEDIEDEKFDLKFSLTLITAVDKDILLSTLNKISEVESIEIEVVESVELEETEDIEHYDSQFIDPKVYKDVNSKKSGDKDKMNKVKKVAKTVRVDIDRLDNLMNLASELIIIKNRMDDLSGTSNREDMLQTIEYLERITTNLHNAVMKVRMVPIERVFNRFPRMVRDLSKELNKKVDLRMYGENTEVDRTVIDEIGDPLIHIIRNSLDHGIEDPQERVKLGKPEEGKLILKAYPDGNNVVIEVIDDGGGIDFEKVKQKSIDRGLITEVEGEKITEKELANILFEPGFSTSDKITEVSGRGVGLDVVKNKIESINGTIELDSQRGKGTTFTIRIPLTLAIIQALLIKLKDETYAIPLSSITEIINVNKENIRSIQEHEIMLYRGKTIPIVRLDKLMGLEMDELTDEYIAVVVRKGDKLAALLVNSLIGQQEIVIKPLGKYLSSIRYFTGATILGNGDVSLILDVNSLV